MERTQTFYVMPSLYGARTREFVYDKDSEVGLFKVTRYGGTIAAPDFAKVGTRLAAHMNLTPDQPVEDKDKDKLAGTQQQ